MPNQKPQPMTFNQFARSPFVCDIGDQKNVHVPRMLRKDWKEWAAEVDKTRRDEILAQFGEDSEAKAKFLAFYVIPPISPRELRNQLSTFEGQESVIKRCLGKLNGDLKLTPEQINDFMEYNDPIDLEFMAMELACIRRVAPTPPPGDKPEDKETGQNPSLTGDQVETMGPKTSSNQG